MTDTKSEIELKNVKDLANLSKASQEEPKFHYGIVAALDALGVASLRVEEAKDYLRNKDFILESVDKIGRTHLEAIYPVYSKSIKGPLTFSFGDTIILVWEVFSPDDKDAAISIVGDYIRYLFLNAFENRVFLRGSISMGLYAKDERSILGPALADAVAWYEATDWMGVIATPMFGLALNFYSDFEENESDFQSKFVKAEVPLKNGSAESMWALAWPYDFYKSDESNPKALYDIWLAPTEIKHHSFTTIPFGTESKYRNTERFFNFYGEHVFKKRTDWSVKSWFELEDKYYEKKSEKGKK